MTDDDMTPVPTALIEAARVRATRRGTPAERFQARVQVGEPDDCWPWIGRSTYSEILVEGRRVYAHRFAYELAKGPIPDGLDIDHLCRNPPCCNPAHLEAVTPQENNLRGVGPAALNSRKTHCIHGHEFTPTNTRHDRLGRACRACGAETQRRYQQRLREHRATPTDDGSFIITPPKETTT